MKELVFSGFNVQILGGRNLVKQQKIGKAEFDISNLSKHDCSHILNSNPVLVPTHFQHRVVFF